MVTEEQVNALVADNKKKNRWNFLLGCVIVVMLGIYVVTKSPIDNLRMGAQDKMPYDDIYQIHAVSSNVDVYKVSHDAIKQQTANDVVEDRAKKYLSHKNAHVMMLQEVDVTSNLSVVIYLNSDKKILQMNRSREPWYMAPFQRKIQTPKSNLQYSYNLCIIGHSDVSGNVISIGDLMSPFETQSITNVYNTIKISYDMKYDNEVYKVMEWIGGDVAAQIQVKLKKYGSMCYFK